MNTETRHYIARLEHALSDSRHQSCAYEILARFGEMERTPNGYVAISPETVDARCKRLIAKLSQP